MPLYFSVKASPRKRNVVRVRSLTEQDRNHRERTLTSDSMMSNKGRSRSFTEDDKHREGTNLKKTTVTAHSSHTAAPEETATAEKKVVVVGKCQNVDSVNEAALNIDVGNPR